ncbi:hypothetical protein PRZ48_007115 [Zasmidium cellare]|uniref:Uncharacterized protein n=1 Tax=Zasmidium cellare TaxID=395010 RepID=A0ABR0EIG8_ZASCE|nr:hypothetical protein PRZ48_007115 [Zasmidium cellare]
MFKPPHRIEELGPINHAVFILLSDIDAVKDHHADPDYKYKTYMSSLDSMDLLIRQYNLRNKSGTGGSGPLIPLEKTRFMRTFEGIVKDYAEKGYAEHVWKKGSSALKISRVNKARELSRWMREEKNYAAYDRRLTKWRYSDVSKAMQEYSLLDEALLEDADSDAPDESNLVDPKVKRSAKRAFSEAISESDDDMPIKLKPKLGTSASIDTREESPLSQSSIEDPAPAEKPSMEDVPNMMEQMSKQLGDVSRALLDHFRLPHHLPSVFDPTVSQRDLQRLFKTCWGDDWPTVGKEIHNLFPESDLVQSLVSAYLQNIIFKPIGPRWNGYVSDIQSMLRDKPKGGRGKSFTQKISSILFRRTESTRNRLQTMIDESFAAALHNSNKRAELAAIFLENLTTTLTPMIQGLQKVAELYKPYGDFSKWREVLQMSLRTLLDTALMIKWSTEPTPDNTFDFIWSGYGGPVAPTMMKTRARSLRDSPAIVLTTLVPGLQVEYQESGRIQTQVLRPAEVLERIQSSMPSDASSSVAATDTSP